jgi:hypothetical protein
MWKSFVLELHGEWSEFAGECIGLWVLKKSGRFWDFRTKTFAFVSRDRLSSYEVAGTGDIVGRLRNRTSRLMFWAVVARKNCSRTNFNRRSRSRWRPMWLRLFSSAKSASTFFRWRCAYLNSSVGRRSLARCRAASFMWMARLRKGPVVHCDLSWHGPHFLQPGTLALFG